MFDRSCAFRISACSLAVAFVLTSGCAQPMPPPASYASELGEVPARFSAKPHITTDDEPIRFVGLTAAQREVFEKHRESFEQDRQQRIEARKDAAMTGPNSTHAMTGQCILQTLIIFSPLCLVIVPFSYGMGSAVEGRIASRQEEFLPSLPSDRELSRLHEKIKQQLTAPAVARRVLSNVRWDGQASSDSGFPRLLIRADSATFGPDRMIAIKFVVQAEPAAGVTWSPTEHRYHLGYDGNVESLDRGLNDAAASLAQSILATYGPIQRPSVRLYVP